MSRILGIHPLEQLMKMNPSYRIYKWHVVFLVHRLCTVVSLRLRIYLQLLIALQLARNLCIYMFVMRLNVYVFSLGWSFCLKCW